jgi:hypothetical protein
MATARRKVGWTATLQELAKSNGSSGPFPRSGKTSRIGACRDR